MGRYDNLHGDEDEIEAEYKAQREAYEDEHADYWKYEDERFYENYCKCTVTNRVI